MGMQLTFPNGEHPGVAFNHGEISVGSRAGLGISLPGKGLAPHQASFIADRRGLWLRVPGGTPGVHLNARPIRRLALLRPGDQVCLEQVQILITEDSPQVIDRKVPATAPAALPEAQRVSASRVLLRGVSGSHFGRSFNLSEPKVLGRSSACDISIDDPSLADRQLQLELHGDRVILRGIAANESTLVNGVPVRDAILAPGDQIVLDQHRFVLEAPGLPSRGQEAAVRSGVVAHTQTIKAVKVTPTNAAEPMVKTSEPEPAPAVDPGALWWLIAAAAVLAAALTALLVYSPRIGA
jgi:pSer/pThr/pTyr-binding forkhead associated (FHA) protein